MSSIHTENNQSLFIYTALCCQTKWLTWTEDIHLEINVPRLHCVVIHMCVNVHYVLCRIAELVFLSFYFLTSRHLFPAIKYWSVVKSRKELVRENGKPGLLWNVFITLLYCSPSLSCIGIGCECEIQLMKVTRNL